MLAALAGAAIVSYLTRASISPAVTTIQKDLRLSDVEMGYVLGGFFMGYIWLQIPGGWLVDRVPPRTAARARAACGRSARAATSVRKRASVGGSSPAARSAPSNACVASGAGAG